MKLINLDRMSEIATAALHKLVEDDRDSAYRFFSEEIGMNTEEIEFFGLTRNRKAINIEWEEKGLPNEVKIPSDDWEIDNDDIVFYLEEKYDRTVVDYDIEEEEE